jgi:hypothetical protein
MPTESASSLAVLLCVFDFVVAEPSVATESMEVSPSTVDIAVPSKFEGMEMVVSPAETEDVDFRGIMRVKPSQVGITASEAEI